MYSYSLTQWMVFFFWYCFVGWIWECFYVSAKRAWKTKKLEFINRGFLHGPFIPIYGFAAITILLATIRLRENTLAVYVLGALTATLFELVTGTAMERLFKVKYWDYSVLPLNYHGHICLFVSLFWGFFSVLLVRVIHVPVERALLRAPEMACEIAAFALMAVFSYDTSVSFNEAMDLRELLESLSESNETLQKLERRVDAVVAFAPITDIDDLKEIKQNIKETVMYNVERLRKQSTERLKRLKEHLELPEWKNAVERDEILEQIELQMRKIFSRQNKQYLRAARQLRRNPTLISLKHKESLEKLKNLLKK